MSDKIKLKFNIVVFLSLILLILLLSPNVVAVHNIQESETDNITNTTTSDNITNTTTSDNIIDVNTGPVNLSISNDYSMNVSVSITDFNISLNNLNQDSGVGSIKAEHEGFGKEEAKMAQTGICAVGLAGTDIPIGVEDNGSIDSTADAIENPNSNRASDIVEVCTDYD